MNSVSRTDVYWRLLRGFGNLIACASILAVSGYLIVWINQTEPTAEQIKTTRKSSALVETLVAKRGTYSPSLVVLGTVQPAQEIVLSPRVSGNVIELSPAFVPGGMVRKGDLLLKIDPADFENALAISQSELQKAEASLEIELARQNLAKKELQLLEGTITEINRALVLREPQIASIRAEISAAEAAIERANLDLERTQITAPFDAQILSRAINIGSQVGAGNELARLVGVEEYWVTAAVPVRSLQWVQFPTMDAGGATETASAIDPTVDGHRSDGVEPRLDTGTNLEIDPPSDTGRSSGSLVRLRDPDSWQGKERVGRVSRMIGRLDDETRLARVLVTIPDPLGLTSGQPPLILNSLIETEIQGRPIDDVVRLERAYVRDQDTVWVMKDDKLVIRPTEIVFRDAEFAYIRKGIEDGEEIVISTLATVAEGIGLRRVAETRADGQMSEGELSKEEAAE